MAKKQNNRPARTRRQSKRQRRIKIAVYVMVIAMLLSTFTAGLSIFL